MHSVMRSRYQLVSAQGRGGFGTCLAFIVKKKQVNTLKNSQVLEIEQRRHTRENSSGAYKQNLPESETDIKRSFLYSCGN